MSESSSDRPTFRLPGGLLGMIALIVAVEAAIETHRLDIVSAWADDWRLSAEAARSQSTEADVLCFGDSLVKYGVLPNVITARSGLKAYNLAISSGTMATSYFLFRQSLDSGAHPRAVVIDFAPLMIALDPNNKSLNYAELGTWRDCVDLAWNSRDGDLLGMLIAGKLLPSYRWRFEIRESLRSSLAGASNSRRIGLMGCHNLWKREQGAQPTVTERLHHPQEQILIDGVAPASWSCEPQDLDYAERFLALAEARGITVYWLIPPLSPAVHDRRASRGTDARYDRFVQSIVANHPSIVVLDARNSGYDDSVHHDHVHLNERGGTILSADLADVVLEGMTSGTAPPLGPRVLPPLAGRTGNEPISRVARTRDSSPANGTRR